MSEAEGILTAIAEQPEDETLRLILADWLVDHDEATGSIRAELLRLQVERQSTTEEKARARLDRRAAELLRGRRGVVGPLAPLLVRRRHRPRVGVLEVPSLALFLGAPWMVGSEEALAVGSRWQGHLHQWEHHIPTTLVVLMRDRQRVTGRMLEDFTPMYGFEQLGTFHYRGIVVGDRLLFVTYRTETAGVHPGLYTLQLSEGQLSGHWWVPSHELRGELWLRPAEEEV